ncbi:phage protease [Leeia sp. TBRC 13508]|uniref:Phage protease n=1 Tax=Leeia speluncae TaxID=2884804 RepID=A0ABS8D2A5_9NEIS|nr:phage protease [Leeia speluncae]MCB6182320.1 phage protease [Leeia speluncae]
MDTKTLHIFKAGKHTAMSGVTLAFSESDLAASAAAYDPALHQAPIVVGHPSTDDPAYGWIKSLQVSDDGMFAEPDQVDPAFAEIVNKGYYKKISASFYLPDSPANPVPGVYYLRHVGFLGAQAPAIKGLKNASFASCTEGVIEFSDWGMEVNARLWNKLREWLLVKFGREEADQVVPDWQIRSIEESARQDDEDAPVNPMFSEPNPQPSEENHVTPEEKAALEAENQRLKDQLALVDRAARRASFGEFVDGLVKEGRLLPADKEGATGLLCFAAGDAQQTADFGEAKDATEWFKSFLARVPKQVSYGEHDGANEQLGAGSADFAAPRGFTVNPDAMNLHQRALEYQEKHPGTEYLTAVKIVEKQP